MRITETAVRRPIGAAMVFLVIIVLGAVALLRLPVDLMPSVDFPRITVVTLYPGVGPEEMETLITRPIEQTIAAIDGMERMESTTAEGISRVELWFAWGTDLDAAVNDVRAYLDRLRNRLPEDAELPVTYKFDLSSFPIAFLGVRGHGDVRRLRYIAEDALARRLERVSGVAAVQVRGGRVREIKVLLDAARLSAVKVSGRQVSDALARRNRNVSAGNMIDTGREVLIRSLGEFESVEDMANTVVTFRSGRPVKVGDVAEVVDSYEDLTSELWINGRPGIRLSISKKPDANTVEVVERLRRELAAINRDYEGTLELTLLWDSSDFIKQAVTNVRSATLYGAFLAVLVLFFFLRSVRATAVIAVSIPISILATFALMELAGLSLNIISFGGLALGVGMLVDSSIVILENIYRRWESGEEAFGASIAGSAEVATAIVASTTTTLVVFAPVLFLGGFASIFFREMALVVSFALLCALVAALTLVPMLTSKAIAYTRGRREPRLVALGRFLEGVEATYAAALGAVTRRPKTTITVASATFLASLFLFRYVDSELIPETDEGRIDVSVDLPVGTPIETSIEVMQDLERRALGVVLPDELDSIITVAGPEAWWRATGPNQGTMQLNLVPVSTGRRGIDDVVMALRKACAGVPAAKVQIRRGSSNILLRIATRGSGDRLSVEIRGHDLATADQLAEQVRQLMESVPGVTFARPDRDRGMMERAIRTDRERLAELGMTHTDVAESIEHYVLGKVSTRLRDRGDEFNIRVQLREGDRKKIDQLGSLPIVTPGGGVIPLESVVSVERRTTPATIGRSNQERIVRVNGGFAGRPLEKIVKDIEVELKKLTVPDGFSVSVGGETVEQAKTFSALLVGVLLAVFLVYAVMSIQFESLLDPLIVMTAVPFAFIGVAGTLLLTKITFNMNSFLGAIVLVGIVVNNAIVLIDYVNRLRREEGMPLVEALVLGARRRLRPILMTSLTTILGMLPLALSLGEGSELQAPLAIVIIGGLTTSTFITLFFVPTLYLVLERARERRRARRTGPAEAS